MTFAVVSDSVTTDATAYRVTEAWQESSQH